MNRQLATIYRKAARALEDKGWKGYCCNAIDISHDRNNWDCPIETFAKIFGHPKNIYTKKFGINNGWYGKPNPQRQEARRIALCLAAAVVESGDL